MTPVESPPLDSSPVRSGRPARDGRPGRDRWIWTALAVALLIGSGVARSVQANRYEQEQNVDVLPPFPLRDIPRTVGDWKVVDGTETALDPLTTRITGSTDHIMRTYSDQVTGVALSVLILYGPAEPVLPHTPQVCYPASGFHGIGDTIDHEITIGPADHVSFRSSVFGKSGGRAVIHQAVYHSYRYNGTWSPTISDQKIPRHKSGIFKVQVQRRVIDGERRGQDEPIESFVKALVPILEAMIRDASAPPTPAVPAAA